MQTGVPHYSIPPVATLENPWKGSVTTTIRKFPRDRFCGKLVVYKLVTFLSQKQQNPT